MKVLRLHAQNDLRLHEEPIPTPLQNEALIRVTAVGICGSDLHWYKSAGIGDARLDHPLVLGHEFAGVVETGILKGKLVAIDPALPCGICEFCLEGNPNLCINMHFAGHGKDDGALREYINWPESALFPLPAKLDDEIGVMLEPFGVALHAANLAKLKPAMTIGVFGCGPIGLSLIQIARLRGANQIYATDRLPHRVEAAFTCGAHNAIKIQSDTDVINKIQQDTHNRGLDVTFEAAGDQDAVDTAIALTKPGGTVILAGIPSNDHTSFVASTARRKGLTIRLVRRMKFTYASAIRLAENGQVNLSSLITHRFTLEQANQAFASAEKRDGLKIIIRP
jgi:L-iditol 2-dehydrogenase